VKTISPSSTTIPASDLISLILKIASYTYGPLLGLFAFGIFTKRNPKAILVPFICVLIPFLCFYLDKFSANLFGAYKFGYEMLIINGTLTFVFLYLSSFFTSKKSN